MKGTLSIIGFILILFGIVTLAHKGYNYTNHEAVAQLGTASLTVDAQKTAYFSPLVGAASLAAGLVLLAISSRKNES